MKFKKILPILSTGIILSSNACAFANTTNNDDSQETSLVNTVKEDSNDSVEQNVQDNNDSVEQPAQDDNDSVEQPIQDDNNDQSYANDYIITDRQPINGHNNYTISFKQVAGFKNYSVNYANYAESTAKITITDPNGRDTIYYSHTGKEIHIKCNSAKAGHYDVRIESQNPHLNLDGYLSIKEY